jgi:integrase/recombinase XerD
MTSSTLPVRLEAFFTDRLVRQRRASPHTIGGYRDTFRLLLAFARQQLKKEPSRLTIPDLDAPLIGAFLHHLEKDRGNSARTRNVRLAAIHSFFQYLALEEPGHSAIIQRVLAMPSKRYDRRPIGFLTRSEMEALLAAPDRRTWSGRRDHALLLVAVQTGLRVSELIGLQCQHIVLGTGAHVRCHGKGRKERCTPLRKEAVAVLRSWLRERAGAPPDPAFPNARGGVFSRDGVAYLLAKHLTTARQRCHSLKGRRVSPHVLRHNTETSITVSHSHTMRCFRLTKDQVIRIISSTSNC